MAHELLAKGLPPFKSQKEEKRKEKRRGEEKIRETKNLQKRGETWRKLAVYLVYGLAFDSLGYVFGAKTWRLPANRPVPCCCGGDHI